MPKEIYDVTVSLHAETTKAILVCDGGDKVWLPKSQIEYEKQSDGLYVVTAPIWLLKDKGLL